MAAHNSKKTARGRPFKKGVSGNPGGRPKDELGLRELCRALSVEAVGVLKTIMLDTKAPKVARISAATALLDRGFGKPRQAVDVAVTTSLEDLVRASMSAEKSGSPVPNTGPSPQSPLENMVRQSLPGNSQRNH